MDHSGVGLQTPNAGAADTGSQVDERTVRDTAGAWQAAMAAADEGGGGHAGMAGGKDGPSAGNSGSTEKAGQTRQPASASEPPHSQAWWWLHDHGLAKTRHEQAQDLRRYYSTVRVTDENGHVVDTSKLSDDDLLALNRQLRGQPFGPPVAAGAVGPGEAGGSEKTGQGQGASGTRGVPRLPANPDDLVAQGWKETSHPAAAAAGRRTFQNPKTGEIVEFDKAKPGATGFRGQDHYHVRNPRATGKSDYYLDKNGNPVPDGSKASHLSPNS